MPLKNLKSQKNLKCLCEECQILTCDKKKSLVKRKQGKTNRNTGRYAENKLLALFKEWDIPIEKTVASGQLKSVTNRVKNQKYLFSGDFYTTELIKGIRVKIENKKRQYSEFRKFYMLTDYDICHIKGFCYLVSQAELKRILDKENEQKVIEIEDKKFTGLHNFFNQDNADIVTLIAPNDKGTRYLDFIFCFKENIYKKLIEQVRN